MKIGTKSLLFGVHQFLYHPWTVAKAWRRLYGCWPGWREWVAIFLHDNYWGMPNIDGPEGKTHPSRNAKLARRLGGEYAEELVLFHSRDFARAAERNPSALCAPDKYSFLLEPRWWYMLRARLSGELQEFKACAIAAGQLEVDATDLQWYAFYKKKVMDLFEKVIYLPLKSGVWAKVNSDCPVNIWQQKWSYNEKKNGRGYAYRTVPGTKKHQMLHYAVLGVTPGAGEIDHKNGDSLDNRRENLRLCEHNENGRNLKKWSTPTSSKFKGVSFHKQSGQWRAYITLGAVQKHLGIFSDETEAAIAYNEAAKNLFGRFARLNQIISPGSDTQELATPCETLH